MKKDFSQAFTVESIRATVLIKDGAGKYLVTCATDELKDEFCRASLRVELDPATPLAVQLTQQLFANGFILRSFRELASYTNVAFSFADNTPGSETQTVCLEALVDVVDDKKLDGEAVFVGIHDLLSKMAGSPFFDAVTAAGIAQLIAENKALEGVRGISDEM